MENNLHFYQELVWLTTACNAPWDPGRLLACLSVVDSEQFGFQNNALAYGLVTFAEYYARFIPKKESV